MSKDNRARINSIKRQIEKLEKELARLENKERQKQSYRD